MDQPHASRKSLPTRVVVAAGGEPAFAEAAARAIGLVRHPCHVRVIAVTSTMATELAAATGPAPGANFAPVSPETVETVLDQQDAAAEVDARATADAVGGATVDLVHGYVVDALLTAALDADLLIVGASSRARWSRLLFGSVEDEVADHASCPVLVLPHI